MEPFWAHGTVVTIGSVEIGGITGITEPDRARGEVETTHAGSGGDRKFLPGFRDNGSLGLEMRRIASDPGQLALRANYAAASHEATEEIVITLPPGATLDSLSVPTSEVVTITFDGWVSALGGSLPQAEDEAASMSATIRVSGAVTELVA